MREYLVALRECHNLTHKESSQQPRIGDVVLIKSDIKSKVTRPMGVVEPLHPGKDGVVRAVGVRTANGQVEGAPQHLYPLELSCELPKKNAKYRSRRIQTQTSAQGSANGIRSIEKYESEEI